LTGAIVGELRSQQIFAGNFYWFEHNWHYIGKWDHLKTEKTLNKLTPAQSAALKKLATQDFSMSDAVMSCCISTAIGLTWTEDQLKEKASKLSSAIKKVLAKHVSTSSPRELDPVS
jgi:8-amino-3,8-dideoxy-alpha-D-manno-octulosonate transaminase